ALLGGRQEAAVTDLPHIELQRVGGLEPLVVGEDRVLGLLFLFLLDEGVDVVERRQQLELRLGNAGTGRLWKCVLHVLRIGYRKWKLEPKKIAHGFPTIAVGRPSRLLRSTHVSHSGI